MNKLSALIITYNEEKNIERCLNSLKDVADEIVVIDSFSTDKTEEICKNHNVRFIKQEFLGYIEQKNYTLQYANFDLILSIDADEALSEELAKSILLEKKDFNCDAYTMNRLTNYCGKWIKHSGWYPDKKLRLFKKGSGKWGGINPHDKFIQNTKTKPINNKGNLLHYSYYSIEEHVNQINKFSTIKAMEMFKSGKKFNFLKMLSSSFAKFIKHYFVKSGFLDGWSGLIISINSAHSTFLKYVKLRQYIRDAKK